jgi:PAS domain S-box-containing protein
MGKPLHVLMVEDSQDDALLLLFELERVGYELIYERVENRHAMGAALDQNPWDLVLADYDLPDFNGLDALMLIKEKGLDLPFIIVSGRIGEQIAVEAMKAGAHDYIFKNNLARFVPAIERELREAKIRHERKQAEETERRNNKLVALIKNAQSLYIATEDPKKIFASLLEALVSITESEYGFLDEVVHKQNDEIFKRSLALTNLSWNEHAAKLYDQLVSQKLEFENLNNLAGLAAITGKVIISNDLSRDPNSKGLPPGHPPIQSFMGIPMFLGGELVGVAGVANRPGGYTQAMADFLGPFIYTCTSIIHAIQHRKKEKDYFEAIEKSEQKYRQIVETANEGIWAIDSENRTMVVNQRMADILGYDPEEMIGQPISTFIFEADIENHRNRINSRRQGNSEQYEQMFQRKDGEACWLLVSASPLQETDGKFIGSFAMVTDITERKETQKKLQESELSLKETQKIAHLGRWKANPLIDYLEWSEEIFEIFEVPRDYKLTFSKGLEFFLPEYLPIINGTITHCLATGEHFILECQVKTISEKVLWIEVRGLSSIVEGKRSYLVGTFQDITERKRAEKSLQESEERFKSIFHKSGIGMALSDLKGKVLRVNSAFCKMLGYSEKEFMNHSFQEFTHPDDREAEYTNILSLIEGKISSLQFQKRYLHADNHVVWTLVTVSMIRDAQGIPLFVAGQVQDITENKQAEELLQKRQAELAHAQRLSVLGEMASNLAHELNQPLCAVINHADACVHLLRSEMISREELLSSLEAIAGQADRAGKIIHLIRNFIRKGSFLRSKNNLNQIIKDGIAMVQSSLNQQRVSLELKLSEPLPSVNINPIQIEQVVINLIQNALDAMNDKDILPRKVIIKTLQSEDGMVVTSICDTGKGISDEIRNHLFDSFFTTKPEGLGLGLSICRSIIENHGGKIWCYSSPENGTTFCFSLTI